MKKRWNVLVVLAILVVPLVTLAATPPWYPAELPGKAAADKSGDIFALHNSALSIKWDAKNLKLQSAQDTAGNPIFSEPIELFNIQIDGKQVLASQLKQKGGIKIKKLSADSKSPNWGGREKGVALRGTFEDPGGSFRIVWSALMRNHSNYIRQELEIYALKPIQVGTITLLKGSAPDAQIKGRSTGSPIGTPTAFMGLESPLAKNSADHDAVDCTLPLNTPLNPGRPFVCSSVIGVYAPGQLRRCFLYYLERERAHSYRIYLHYNSWFDLDCYNLTEEAALASFNAIGTELVKKRGVKMDGFVIDDGWDSTDHVWQFSKHFPDGFTNLAKATKKYGAGIGIWLSPWGGYGRAKNKRMANAAKYGYETNEKGFSMAGKNYGAYFEKTCAMLMTKYGVNYFKFDGMGRSGGGADITAILNMSRDLRKVDRNVWINATTGTWQSPFWTRYADSIWRQGSDTSFKGVGSKREQWINYRDVIIYSRMVKQGPLYPLNALMFHGIVIGKTGNPGKMEPDELSVRHEARIGFGGGSGLQELYITPSLLTPKMWDDIAEAAKWARDREDILYDTHWAGGNPQGGGTYGWASWSRDKGALALRNSADSDKTFEFIPRKVFELPQSITGKVVLTASYPDQSVQKLSADCDESITVTLKPFDVLVFDAEIAE
jgi:hypothetical protein